MGLKQTIPTFATLVLGGLVSLTSTDTEASFLEAKCQGPNVQISNTISRGGAFDLKGKRIPGDYDKSLTEIKVEDCNQEDYLSATLPIVSESIVVPGMGETVRGVGDLRLNVGSYSPLNQNWDSLVKGGIILPTGEYNGNRVINHGNGGVGFSGSLDLTGLSNNGLYSLDLGITGTHFPNNPERSNVHLSATPGLLLEENLFQEEDKLRGGVEITGLFGSQIMIESGLVVEYSADWVSITGSVGRSNFEHNGPEEFFAGVSLKFPLPKLFF